MFLTMFEKTRGCKNHTELYFEGPDLEVENMSEKEQTTEELQNELAYW